MARSTLASGVVRPQTGHLPNSWCTRSGVSPDARNVPKGTTMSDVRRPIIRTSVSSNNKPCSSGSNPFPKSLPSLYEFTLPWILTRIPLASRILEIGCGPGDLISTVFAAKHPTGLVAIDIDDECVRATSRLLSSSIATIIRYDAESPRIVEDLGTFDVVLCRNTFHHFHRKDDFLIRVREELLRPGGRFLLIDLDAEGNFGFGGAAILITVLRTLLQGRAHEAAHVLFDTRFFLRKAIRAHRRQDRERLSGQGWYHYAEVVAQLHLIFPAGRIERLGSLFGLGGCYAFEFAKPGTAR